MFWTLMLRWVDAAVNGVIIGSENGLGPPWHQAITLISADFLSIGPLETNFGKIWIKM